MPAEPDRSLKPDFPAAVAAGVISAEQAERLHTLWTVSEAPVPAHAEPPADPSDNERFRVLGGFSDVFVAIGIFLLYGAILTAAGSTSPLLLAPIGAVAAWVLSEIFSRRMRLALPSLLLAIAFAVSMLALVFFAFLGFTDGTDAFGRISFTRWFGPAGLLAGAGMLLAAWLHFRRFGVPINWAIGAAGIILVIFSTLTQVAGIQVLAWMNDLIAVFGFAVFGMALWLDSSDPRRVTTRSDCAFWLHLLAAPTIVPPIIGGYVWGGVGPAIMLVQMTPPTMATLVAVIAVFMLIAIVSIIIDRRALLVSGLGYTGVAIAMLAGNLGLRGGQGALIFTLLVLAAIVLSMSAFWQTLRRAIVPRLPLGQWRVCLPPA